MLWEYGGGFGLGAAVMLVIKDTDLILSSEMLQSRCSPPVRGLVTSTRKVGAGGGSGNQASL